MATAADGEIIRKRVFVGGLPLDVDNKDVEDRFGSFGNVLDFTEAAKGANGVSRRFVHFTLQTTETKWKKLVSAYNGSSWRGNKLRVEEASATIEDRLVREQRDAHLGGRVRVRGLIRHKYCGELMSDAQIEKRVKGWWKRGRYGRAIAMLKMRRPDGKLITVDPSHYKENVEKLFGSVRPKPISQLVWSSEDGASEGGASEDGASEDGASESDQIIDENEETIDTDRFGAAVHVLIADAQERGQHFANLEQDGKYVQNQGQAEGFSLCTLLGFEDAPAMSIAAAQGAAPTTTTFNLPAERKHVASADELLFDADEIKRIPIEQYAFCRRTGEEEARLVWKSNRSSLRADYRKKMKHSKRATAK